MFLLYFWVLKLVFGFRTSTACTNVPFARGIASLIDASGSKAEDTDKW